MNLEKTGSMLKDLRKEKGMTQEQLGEKFGVSRRTVSRWETGSNMPDLDVLVELSDSYDGDIVTIHLYEAMPDHDSTWDWYYVDRNTGETTNFMGESFNIFTD